jgi:hypothetical protein
MQKTFHGSKNYQTSRKNQKELKNYAPIDV